MFGSRVLPLLSALALALGIGLVAQPSPAGADPQLSEGCDFLHSQVADIGTSSSVFFAPKSFAEGEQLTFTGTTQPEVELTVNVNFPNEDVLPLHGTTGEPITYTVPFDTGLSFKLMSSPESWVTWQVDCGLPEEKQAQTISFTSTAPANAVVFEGPYDVSASATSGLPVSFSIDPASEDVCWVLPGPGGPGTGMVFFAGVGTCTIHADQAGNDEYLPAEQVSQSFEIHKTPTMLAAQKACKCLGLTPTTFKATLSWSHPMGPGTITEGLPGQTVSFAVKGKTVCSATTDSNGFASCKATLGLGVALTASSYTATYAGTDRFEAATATAKIE